MDDELAALNGLRREELGLIDSYDRLVPRVREEETRDALRDARDAHARRADVLRDAVARLGGNPASSSDRAGAMAAIVERIVPLLGDRLAVVLLEQAEDALTARYRSEMQRVGGDARRSIEAAFEQQRQTHVALVALRGALR